jgi:hypothetical protein
MMRLRMSLGVPAEEVAETARLLLDRIAPEPPGIGALAVAALAAHLAGDEDAEHGYAREMLARTTASRDPGQRLEVIRSATGRDHPGETCELIEPYLREHPDKWMDDERAGQKAGRSRPAGQDMTDALMAEVAVFFPFTGEAGDAEKDDGAPDTPLRAFAADPETPAGLAVRAAGRDEHARYGIWQVADPSPSPGVVH